MPNQLLAIKFIAVLLFLLAIFAGGYHVRDLSAVADIAKMRTENAEATEKAATKAISDLAAKQTEIAKIDHDKTQEILDANVENKKLHAALATGAKRLSIALSKVPATCSADSPRVGDGETRAYIDPEASERIISITDDGDQAIRQLDACQNILNVLTTP